MQMFGPFGFSFVDLGLIRIKPLTLTNIIRTEERLSEDWVKPAVWF